MTTFRSPSRLMPRSLEVIVLSRMKFFGPIARMPAENRTLVLPCELFPVTLHSVETSIPSPPLPCAEQWLTVLPSLTLMPVWAFPSAWQSVTCAPPPAAIPVTPFAAHTVPRIFAPFAPLTPLPWLLCAVQSVTATLEAVEMPCPEFWRATQPLSRPPVSQWMPSC